MNAKQTIPVIARVAPPLLLGVAIFVAKLESAISGSRFEARCRCLDLMRSCGINRKASLLSAKSASLTN